MSRISARGPCVCDLLTCRLLSTGAHQAVLSCLQHLRVGSVRRAVLLLAFTIPKAYELRKDEIDHMFHKAQHHGKVRSEVPVLPQGVPVRSSLHFLHVLERRLSRQ